MKAIWAGLLVLCLLTAPLTAQEAARPDQQITDLDQLLNAVRQEQQAQRARNKQREKNFLREKQKQQALLDQARRDFERRQRENQPLVTRTEVNAGQIARLEKELEATVQDMGDLATGFREFAGDFAAVLGDSMISAQFPGREEQLEKLAAMNSQPSIEEIETLWLLVQEEMTEAGKVALFTSPVVRADGSSEQQQVLRIGTFSAYADGNFLRYVPETGEMLVLSRQPASHLRADASEFASLPGGQLAPVTVDPTRGSLLGMLSYTPSVRERIDQGGTIALIIIGLGIIGLLMAAWRGVYLASVFIRINRQQGGVSSPNAANPLGRVLLAADGVSLDEEELLQLKLDEAVLAEMPALERGNGVIKLLAATSPLLGLLGTVTGMILTFQAISLFGTGDPKLMAGGISQALVTTVLGLVVAIPLLFSHSVIAYMARSIVQRLDEQCAGVLARAAEQQDSER